MNEMMNYAGFVRPAVMVAAIVACEYFALLLAIILDFRSGCRKARLRGEPRTSKGFRRTVTKAASYFVTLLSLSLMDIPLVITALYLKVEMDMAAPVFPLFTTVGSLAMIVIEGKSIRESADSKSTIGPAVKTIRKAMREGVTAERIIELLLDD